MATPNYGYEKRQRELAKKKKKEDKLKAKAERKGSTGDSEDMAEDGQSTGGEAPPSPLSPPAND